MPTRLGDDVDDFCIKCKRLTNHVVVSLLNDGPAKVRCRTCHSDHDYRNEQAPPPKVDPRKLLKDLAKSAAGQANGLAAEETGMAGAAPGGLGLGGHGLGGHGLGGEAQGGEDVDLVTGENIETEDGLLPAGLTGQILAASTDSSEPVGVPAGLGAPAAKSTGAKAKTKKAQR